MPPRPHGDLFSAAGARRAAADAPLAERLRPASLDEIVGQEELLAPESLLRREARDGRLSSLVLWGPPGCGKTTMARLLAGESGFDLVWLSAVSAGVAEVRRLLAEASQRLGATGRRTLLFVDEIHRFHKGQQDALLHEVEDGRVVLVGATTENPAFHLNGALLSRCRLLQLLALSKAAAQELLQRGLTDARGLGGERTLSRQAEAELIEVAGGDARRLLNHLERAAHMARVEGADAISVEHVRSSLGARVPSHDRSGDRHYDLLSALHKSLRGSDPDAAAYWVHRLLVAGEDPLVVARRLVRMASEDVGLADPRALGVALDALRAVQFLGLPEGDAALCQAAIYLSLAPKSDAVYRASGEAKQAAERRGALDVPPELAGSRRKGARPYNNPHEVEGRVTSQQHLPDALAGAEFYQPGELGFEAHLRERLDEFRRRRRESRSGDEVGRIGDEATGSAAP
jgi:putative ATPase